MNKKKKQITESTVLLKECSYGSLSISIENEDYVLYYTESDTTIRFKSLRIANECYEMEVNV